MKILIACEESQRVCTEFRIRGFDAFSCDLLPTSGSYPQYHFQCDIREVLNYNWDCIIAFPPCTHLCGSGARWFANGHKSIKLQKEAIEFFNLFVNCKCDHIAIENPVGVMNTYYRKPDQIINPWQFGDTDYKRTCLWLKGLPILLPTLIVPKQYRTRNNWEGKFNGKYYSWNDPELAVLRSKTYPGIARAMADQWGDYLLKSVDNKN